jgi:GTP cyclohydrolase I
MCSIIYKGITMSAKTILNHNDIMDLAVIVASKIQMNHKDHIRAYAIPRGGIPALYAVIAAANGMHLDIGIALTPEEADIFVDDIIDSGETMRRYCDQYPGKPFYALIDKTDPIYREVYDWVVFPWEGEADGGIEDNIRRILQFIGEDPNREGLLETPKRVAKAYQEWFDGYTTDIAGLFKTFTDGAEGCDEMIIIDSIPVESFCEHHMARFHGVAHVAYIPDGRIVGLSKIPKLVKAFSHRLQVQERLTNQIADALTEHLKPRGVAVVVQCEHTCMSSRGARVHGTMTTTSSMRGLFLQENATRAEFMSLIPKRK